MIYILLISYLLINSLLTTLSLYDNIYTLKEIWWYWLRGQLFALPITIFNLIPKWHWFYDNVIFWFYINFTDRYKDMDGDMVRVLKKQLGHTRQWRAIEKKYGY